MNDRKPVGRMRMRVQFARFAVCRPARVPDAARALERLAFQPRFEIFQFAFGAPAAEVAVLDGCNACGIVAAIFEPLQRFDEMWSDRLAAENADYPAHNAASPPKLPLSRLRGAGSGAEIKIRFAM